MSSVGGIGNRFDRTPTDAINAYGAPKSNYGVQSPYIGGGTGE